MEPKGERLLQSRREFFATSAGGGVKGGQVIGKTDDPGWDIVEDPIHIHDLHATIRQMFGFDHTGLVYRYWGRDLRLTDSGGTVISKLLA